MELARRRRWSDHDHHVGPFTFAVSKTYRPFAVILSSGSAEREPGCCIRFHAFGATLICELPPIVKPWRRWKDLSGYQWTHDGYWEEHPREYGISLSDGSFLQVFFGAQTHSSWDTQDWSCFLPWTQWRQVAHRIYNADGSLVADVAEKPFEHFHEATEAVVRKCFSIVDYDGQRIDVETYAQEREWRLGTGWFRWLGFIVPKKRARSLDIRFKSEVGPEKGSWKGGMLGHGIEMLAGETQEQAFRRYCEQDHRSKYRRYRIAFADAA